MPDANAEDLAAVAGSSHAVVAVSARIVNALGDGID